jgi:uncharacterized protein DUF6644
VVLDHFRRPLDRLLRLMRTESIGQANHGEVSVDIDGALGWLEATTIASAIGENEILFPWIESVHILAIVLVFGTISIVDLRLLGFASLDLPVRRVMRDVIPYTWGAFTVAAITGSLMFASDAVHYAHNRLFQAKLVLLALAGLNMGLFHLIGVRDIERWDSKAGPAPKAARIAAAFSLLLWIGVVALGRGIGFTMH